MSKTEREQRILKKAEEIARSGRHVGWWYVATELQFERERPLAISILEKEPFRSKLDSICEEARSGGPR
jgi:hypothetical protein